MPYISSGLQAGFPRHLVGMESNMLWGVALYLRAAQILSHALTCHPCLTQLMPGLTQESSGQVEVPSALPGKRMQPSDQALLMTFYKRPKVTSPEEGSLTQLRCRQLLCGEGPDLCKPNAKARIP